MELMQTFFIYCNSKEGQGEMKLKWNSSEALRKGMLIVLYA